MCKTSTVLVGVVFLVVMAAVLLPSRYLSDTEHSTLRSRSSQILHKLEQLEQTTEHGLYQGLQQLEEVAEKGLHKLEEVAETWANGSSARMDAIDTGSADWPNHVYRLPSAPHATSPTAPPTPPKRRRVAYAITITKDGFFQDGAAVLAYSIFSVSRHTELDISLIAFVHPNVSTSRPLLRKLGFHVIEAPKPVNVTAIDDKFTFLKEKLEKNGCCGSAELIKLNSYRLTQYEWVVHMDADTFLNNPIHELFDRDYSLIYTTDPNMATYKKDYCQPAQGISDAAAAACRYRDRLPSHHCSFCRGLFGAAAVDGRLQEHHEHRHDHGVLQGACLRVYVSCIAVPTPETHPLAKNTSLAPPGSLPHPPASLRLTGVGVEPVAHRLVLGGHDGARRAAVLLQQGACCCCVGWLSPRGTPS